MSDDLITLPVRYDKEFRYIFDADDKPLAELATHGGQHIATCINEHTALRDRVTALTEALERAKNELRLHCGRSGCKDLMSVCMLCEIASDIDRALYRGEEER